MRMEQKFYQNENGMSRFPLEDLSAIMMDLHYKTGNNMNIALGIRFQGKLNPEKLERRFSACTIATMHFG